MIGRRFVEEWEPKAGAKNRRNTPMYMAAPSKTNWSKLFQEKQNPVPCPTPSIWYTLCLTLCFGVHAVRKDSNAGQQRHGWKQRQQHRPHYHHHRGSAPTTKRKTPTHSAHSNWLQYLQIIQHKFNSLWNYRITVTAQTQQRRLWKIKSIVETAQ